MKFKSATVLIILVALLSIAVSGCSSWGVALDTGYGNEQFTLESNDNIERGKTDTDLQVGIPKLVSSEKEMRPLYEIGFIGRKAWTYNFGFDYELINYGNDLLNSIKNVINNRSSIVQSLEYQSGTINEENDLYFFSLVPVFTTVLNITDTYFVAYGTGIPIFTSVGFNKEKYDPIDENRQFYFSTGLNNKLNDYSLFFKFYYQELNAEQKEYKKRISIKYNNFYLTLRYYL